ncbi:class I SAM-dependent methyltransferase [Rhodoplanes sp. SY1]|uniref:class I SAM-dependent methyltransferase n=1 Tax=Rhodoplanes sp. SY1 TaxID=3166646 RepID=UPI0038B62B6E
MSALATAKKSVPEPVKVLLRPAYIAARKSLGYAGPAPVAAPEPAPYPWAHIKYEPDTVADEVYHRQYSVDAIENRRFYNIGSGTFSHKYWTNIDLASDWYAGQQQGTTFINYDLFSYGPIPVEDGKAEAVYTSHTVEHVDDRACANMFKEAYRMLKPGGYFRMTTPNIELDLAAWRRGDRDYFYHIDLYSHPDIIKGNRLNPAMPFDKASLEQITLFVFASHVSQISPDNGKTKVTDEEFRNAFATMGDEAALDHFSKLCTIDDQRATPGHHMNWWTFKKAERMLRAAGFKTIYQSGFGQSHCAAMRDIVLFDKQDPKMSLYVEAVK